MDQSRLDGGARGPVLTGRASTPADGRRSAIRFEPPKLASVGGGRISRSAADVGALAEAREQGRAEAMAQLSATIDEQHRAAEALAAAAAALSTALDQLAHADLGRVHQVEQHVLELAVALAEEVVGREVGMDDGVVVAAAARALALAPDRGALVLRVNPADASVVGAAIGEIGAHLASAVQVIPDPSIERAGAVAEAGPLRIDAQISSTFARIREAFAS